MRLKGMTAVLAACCLIYTGGISLSASAYTADDVAAKARQAGWPETLIQMGYNEWSSGDYTQEKLDTAYGKVQEYNSQTKELICNYLGVDPEEIDDPEEKADSTAPENKENPDSSDSEENNTNVTENSTPAPVETVTKKDGTTEQRIESSDFIKMTFEEKIDYVNQLDETSKNEFVGSLSKEEKNSMLKQMPMEDKMALVESYIDTADSMGLNVSVDSLTEENISLTIRNQEGRVVDKAAVGIVVDETGISHTKPLLLSLFGILTAVFGFVGLYRYIRRTEED
ncbi:MAG TPA: hypothetical protein DCO72_11465 [Ruminococcus sp.]|nr:hypothetical protein [Ruminococcus sp.]